MHCEQEQATNPIKFDPIQTKFSELENRLHSLEIEKNSNSFQPINIFPNFDNKTTFKIVDYSPEWDSTKGGTKVIICVSPLCMVSQEMNERLRVRFGGTSVSGYFIQPGVIKCYGENIIISKC